MIKSITEKMHAIVLCAGLGTRLRPLTHVLPKPAVPVGEIPAALRNIEQLLDAGFGVVHCNTHYLAEELQCQLMAAAQSRGWPSERIRFWHEPDILETGGGIARIVHSVSAEQGHNTIWDTLVVSGDIVADIPVAEMLKLWAARSSTEVALMATIPIDKPRKDITWVTSDLTHICGFGADANQKPIESKEWTSRVFSNHQIISGELMSLVQVEKQSSIDLFYRRALKSNKRIIHLPLLNQNNWFDIGTPETYLLCVNKLKLTKIWTHDQALPKLQILISKKQIHTSDAQPGLHNDGQDGSFPVEINQDQNSLNNLNQLHWQWLGRLHSLPTLLRPGLERILYAAQKEGPAFLAKQPYLYSESESFFPSKTTSTPSPDHIVQGYFELAVPSTLKGSPLLGAPLLVRFVDLLPSHFLTEPDSSCSFWILFTPERQSKVR